MIPTIETIVEELIAGTMSKLEAIGWLHAHAEDAGQDLRDAVAMSAGWLHAHAEDAEKGQIMSEELTGSEAVYGFAAWLTTREEKITMSEKHNAAAVVDLVDKFCKTNNLAEPRDDYAKNLTFPTS